METKPKLINLLFPLLVWVVTFQKMWCAETPNPKQFIVDTLEDTEVKFDIQDFHKGVPLASTILISKGPAHGSLSCTTERSNDFEQMGEQCNAITSYLPEKDFSGEDSFTYHFVYENLTTTSESEYEVRLIVRPTHDDIVAELDEVSMKRSDGFVHIPVLKNDKYIDKPEMCFIKDHKKQDDTVEIKFKDIAPELGMDAIQSAVPKSPDCLFDHYDPTLKTWIKGAFCLPEQNIGPGAVADYDNDGFVDIYYARVDGTDQLWRNLGNGSFKLVTAEANLTCTLNHRSGGVAWVDVDNDGDMDLFIGTIAEDRFYFYLNDGMGHFTEDAVARGLAPSPEIPPYKTCTMTIAVGDYNKDGWLDLYTNEWLPHLDLSYDYNNGSHSSARLFKNLGAEGKPGYFEDATIAAGLGAQPSPVTLADKFSGHTDLTPYHVQNVGLFKDIMPGAYIISVLLSDIDDDGNLDLAIAGDFFTSRLYWGTDNGTFVRSTDETGIGSEENGMGSTIADFDNDGQQDWFVTSIYMSEKYRKPYFEAYGQGGGMIFGYSGNRLYKNQGSRKFTDETDVAGVRPGWWAWGAAFFDFDNDGDLDLIHTNGFEDTESTDFDFLHHTQTLLYENKIADNGSLHFESVGDSKGITDRRDGRGLLVFDFDNDGDQDVYIVSNCEKPVFYRNDGGDSKDWIRVKVLEGEWDRESVGAKVYLDSPKFGRELVREYRSVSAFSSQGEYIAHFGLGLETAEKFRIRVYWPVTNNTRVIHNVSRRTMLVVRDLRGRKHSREETFTPEESCSECRKMEVTSISKAPANGQVQRHHNYVTYYPAPGFTGEDSFEYVVSDGITSGTGKVIVKVEKSDENEGKILKDDPTLLKWATYSGFANNLNHSDFGRAMTPLIRLCTSGYDDGFETPAGKRRPNPRNISNILGNQKIDVYSPEGLNEMHMHFGQLVAHDVDFSTPYANSLPTENFAIRIPTGDSWFDPYATGAQTMRFRRSAHAVNTGVNNGVPREQVNKVSSFLDLSIIYGSDDERAAALRSGIDGKLHEEPKHNLGFNTMQLPNLNLLGGPRDKLLLSGDPRVNVQPGLICLHTIWAREHNIVCDELKQQQDLERYDDQTLFQYARTITRAKWQAVVWYEFLPTVIGADMFRQIPRYEGYNSSVEVGVFNEFATAAFRYGHSQVGNTMLRLDKQWNTLGTIGNLELRDAYFNPGRVLGEEGIEPLLRGMLKQRAQKVDTLFADAVRNFLFGTNTQGLDLMTYGIQRGRDHGLADYNSVRKALGLEPKSSFADITSDGDVQQKLDGLYPDVNDIDLWIGGLAEPHVPGGCVGETFATIIAKQFRMLRDGDRYWFESPELYPKTVRMTKYRDATLKEIIARNADISWSGKSFYVDQESVP